MEKKAITLSSNHPIQTLKRGVGAKWPPQQSCGVGDVCKGWTPTQNVCRMINMFQITVDMSFHGGQTINHTVF